MHDNEELSAARSVLGQLTRTLLEVGPAAAADEHSITREYHAAARLGVIADAAVRMTWCSANFKLDAAHFNDVTMLIVDIGFSARGL